MLSTLRQNDVMNILGAILNVEKASGGNKQQHRKKLYNSPRDEKINNLMVAGTGKGRYKSHSEYNINKPE